MTQSSAVAIGLNFDPDAPWLHGVLRGIQEYISKDKPWQLILLKYGGLLGGDQDLLGEMGDLAGLITNRGVDAAAVGLPDRPQVGLTAAEDKFCRVKVYSDMLAVGRLAAEHLIQRGHRTLAAFAHGDPSNEQSAIRIQGFTAAAADAGVVPRVFSIGPRTIDRGRWVLADQLDDLADMLKDMPKPVGLFAYDIVHAWRATMACRIAGLRMPDDVALIAGGEDEQVFAALSPSITGILYDTERVGYLAAQTLDRLMAGEQVPADQPVPPIGVIERESTHFFAIDDAEIEPIIRYIWSHVDQQLSVNDLLDRFPIAQRTLTRRCRAAIGHGPAAEIRRSRIETAKRLLLSTDKPLSRVALESGFPGQSQFCRYIKKAVGLTPGQFRQTSRHR